GRSPSPRWSDRVAHGFPHRAAVGASLTALYRRLSPDGVHRYPTSVPPADVALGDGEDLHLGTQRVARALVRHLRLPEARLVVSFRPMEHAAAVELAAGPEYFVELNDRFRTRRRDIGAALAHEITHVLLHRLGLGFPGTAENEILTDVVTTYLGAGWLLLDAYRQDGVESQKLGYLTGGGAPATAAVAGLGALLAPLDTPATALALPVPRVDTGDPNAGFLAGLAAAAPGELLAALQAAPAPSAELRLRTLRAELELGDLPAAARTLAGLEERDPDDWRVVWYRGVTSLVTGDHEHAALAFDAVYDAFPGEPSPKLALGICAEVLGQLDNAAEYYRLVWATDPSFVSAAFGLARVQLAAGDRIG
ncbi:tetratricopeptide repeat protein, partial [Streptomyces massasporeus]